MTKKILEILINSDDFISGEYISQILGISRNTVWKCINKLRDDGYEITSVTNKGYKLCGGSEVYSEFEIHQKLKTNFIGKKIIFTKDTISTNILAKENSDSADGTVFISETQSSGRGRLGRSWISDKKGIWLSLLLKPNIPIEQTSLITLVAGLAVCRVIGNDAKIKWPNDIILSNKKVCGILTEMSSEITTLNYIVCGIGINLNTKYFQDDLKDKATSLFIETGKKYSKSQFVADLLHEFEICYLSFIENGFNSLLDEYKDKCITLGKTVSITEQGKQTIAKAMDISENGELVINENEKLRNVFSGEVSVRGLLGYV